MKKLILLFSLILLAACASGPKPKEYLVSHILCATEEQANAALSRIRAGEPFEQVARDSSIDFDTNRKGGRIGPWATAATYVAPFADEVERLTAGEVSAKPVETDFGWHVIRVDAIR